MQPTTRKRPSCIPFLVLFCCSAARAEEHSVNGHVFTTPNGFVVEQIAGTPLVDRPIVADFDDEGRLYVADSAGVNDRVEIQLLKKPHKIIRLEDADGDGRFDKRTVFADQMMFPEGALWYDGSLYVSAPPSIWKLTDADGDGVAEKREEWFQGRTLTGCANDLHGPYLGPDGWIYWCKGAFARQTHPREGKKPFTTRAAHIFRKLPSGGDVEPVMTGGMDNPVDVVFTPGGERIFTTTFFQHPGGGNRDGLIHAIYGGVYGKVHDVINEHKRTSGDVMPVLAHLGPAAPCGLTRYESNVFGEPYRDNLFSTLFNLQKVGRHSLTPSGATFVSKDEDFLVSSNRDFHPTDVHEDADGSLVVVDTGGWYKLCCPSSQLVKADIFGGIYRVRRKEAPKLDDPRGRKIAWGSMKSAELIDLLDDSRPAVRRRAIHTLAKQGVSVVPALAEAIRKADSPLARSNAVWAATRIDDAGARAAARSGLDDADETVRQVAAHSASVRRDREALPSLVKLLEGSSDHNRRAAAEALGRLEDKRAVPSLMAATARPADPALEHSLCYALIEIADSEQTKQYLDSPQPAARKAALIALDQMDGGKLEPAVVTANLLSDDPGLKEAASWIVGRHPEWGPALAEFLERSLAAPNPSQAERGILEQRLARFAGAQAVQKLLTDRLADPATAPEVKKSLLRAMAQSGLKEAPPAWGPVVIASLSNADLTSSAVFAARSIVLPKDQVEALRKALLRIGDNSQTAEGMRLEALSATPGGVGMVSSTLFDFLMKYSTPDQPVAIRSAAADVVSKAKLTSEQLLTLARSLRTVGPMEMDRLLNSFEQTKEEAIGLEIVAALEQSASLASLRVETLKPRLSKFGPKVEERAKPMYAALTAELAQQRARMEEMLTHMTGGDVRRGQLVFNSSKAACISCHAIGYVGGNVGPDLTRIGQIRNERDLLEAVLLPSASFIRSYEPVVVVTTDGKVVSGVLRKDAADEVVLATGAKEEARIPRGDVEEMKPGSVSIMPAGLEKQLSTQDLADLIAFLRACR